ncbi:MAG: uncharacterized membrane protein YheB (UPF0754 family) [Parasphingorhabdus sp.]|jgi:uncharacterized membrane protein YheB (UPF0754 family)
MLNKSLISNLLAALVLVVGLTTDQILVTSVGLFALSGAITNWLAVHMLFEKVPGLYGSGVVPSHFKEFRSGIRALMMNQFFTDENIERFVSGADSDHSGIDLSGVLESVDLSPSFDALVQTVQESSFGSMLGMVGGIQALEPLKPAFIEKMRQSLVDLSQSEKFQTTLVETLRSSNADAGIRDRIELIIEQRLEELTPQLVKEIVQQMIHKHLGWLVVWGGVFGGLIGLVAGIIQN